MLLIGLPLGALAGMVGGWVDFAITRLIEILTAVPTLFMYILLMIGATVVAVWGIVVTSGLARSKRHAYRDALIVLALSALLAGVQTFVSIALRGKGAPQNMRFYITAFTLVAFLLLRLPPIWKLIGGFRRGGDAATTIGLAAFVGGLVVFVLIVIVYENRDAMFR